MTDYKLTVESLSATPKTVSVIAVFEVFPSGSPPPAEQKRKSFLFPAGVADAVVANEIDKWFSAEIDIHASRIAKADEPNRLAALKAVLERTESI